ncbi:aminoglycoside phosphotransferase family protein [Paenibacillus sp. PR3]|uniref:Aminoglycoside phosphotransferase family protein n=1 Tax=Paenibacillus terricola TaxID=2763503 RepID=A0ABR8MTM0_9BACL|nr:aminoglycoside phosphotransferase family protein [Paenibacillus terricola]MBD3919302.1 aminoglycoside phosphotransferase family protein [Paenibacillus terricola]
MNENYAYIRNKVEQIVQGTVDAIEPFENVPNNKVYKIIANGKPYIFKTYKQRTWPEDGKLAYVNRQLIEHHIRCAKLIVFDRSDPYFETGYLIEEYVPGTNAALIAFDLESGSEFYAKLARLVSQVHAIRVRNYGYIGSGEAGYTSFSAFMSDNYDDISNALICHGLFEQSRLNLLKEQIMARLRLCDNLPSVLNHGDLSTKNVMIDAQGELTLIDWDDAMSYNWMAELARLTYWMKFQYNDQQVYNTFRSSFLAHYTTDYNAIDFEDFEHAYHIWIGLDHLNYYVNTPQYEQALAYFNECVARVED